MVFARRGKRNPHQRPTFISWCLPVPPGLAVPANEGVGRTVVAKRRLGLRFQLRNDPVGEHLAKLHAPLVEGLTPQIQPCVKTLCSYNATRLPSTRGGRRSARIVVLGRLPGNVLCGTSGSGTPSARTSAAVFPKASASACAKTFDISRS